MNYMIRKATKDDLEHIIRLGNKSLDEYERTHLGDEMVDSYIKSGKSSIELIENIDNTNVLIYDDTIIGFICWKEDNLTGFVIDSSHWGTGAAQHFLNSMLSEKLRLYKEVSLECFESSPRANSFYKKMGWVNVDTISDESANRVIYKKLRY